MSLSGAYLPDDQSDFIDLIFAGEFEEALDALAADPKLNINFYTDHPTSKTVQGVSPFMMACYFGEIPLAWALLNRGATLDATDLGGKTALHYAVVGTKSPTPTSRNDIIYLLAFLNRDLLTRSDSFGNNPLHLAALQGRVEAVEVLVDIEKNLQYQKNTKTQKTPLKLLTSKEGESYQTIKTILSESPPSLMYLCLAKLSEDPLLRAPQQVPAHLKESVKLYTPQLTKWVERLTSSSTGVDELAAKLKTLTIR